MFAYKRTSMGLKRTDTNDDTRCPLCKKRGDNLFCKKDGVEIVKCNFCGLAYVKPLPSNPEVERLYHQESISPSKYYKENEKGDRITFKRRLRDIEKYVKKGRVLDIGCNIGTFLKVAKDSGWKCYGIDIKNDAEKECKKAGIKFMRGTVESIRFNKEFFDVIIMNDFLEHIPNPNKVMEKVHRMTKKGGIVFIVTPDIGSKLAMILRKRWHHMKPDEHLVYFNRKTIKKFLEAHKFIVEEIKHVGRWRKIETIIEKSRSLLKNLPRIKPLFPMWLLEKEMPFNFHDEICVIAKKKG